MNKNNTHFPFDKILLHIDTYKLCVLSCMINNFIKNLPASFHDMFNTFVKPNRKKSYKLEQVIFKTLGCFPSALFPKIWNSIELELKEDCFLSN